jgi:hypothetical protein
MSVWRPHSAASLAHHDAPSDSVSRRSALVAMCFRRARRSNGSGERLREMTNRHQCHKPIPALIGELNRHLQGWMNYFSFGYPSSAYCEIERYVRDRLIQHLQRRSQQPYCLPQGEQWLQHLARLGLVRLSGLAVAGGSPSRQPIAAKLSLESRWRCQLRSAVSICARMAARARAKGIVADHRHPLFWIPGDRVFHRHPVPWLDRLAHAAITADRAGSSIGTAGSLYASGES